MNLINNRYKILSNIKDNTNDLFFLVSDLFNDNKKLALRIINSDLISSKAIDFIKKDFISFSSLHHPNIAYIYGVGVINNIDGNYIYKKQYFCTFEHIESTDLFKFSSDLDFKDLINIIVQICSGLYYLHKRGHHHGNLDFKSIIVSKSSNSFLVKILPGLSGCPDFDKLVLNLKKSNHQFRAPEVLKDNKITYLSDLYSLGVIIFYLFSRQNPGKNNFLKLWESDKKGSLDSSCIPLNMKDSFINLIDKLTCENPDKRYQNVIDVVKELEKICNTSFTLDTKPFKKIITKTKLIGREENILQLYKWKNKIANNSTKNRIFCIHGETGIGKTRLLKEFSFHMNIDKLMVFSGVSSDNDKNNYEPFIQILNQIIPLAHSDILEKYGPELVKVLPDEKHLKGIVPSPPLSTEKEKLRLKIAIASFISNVLEKKLAIMTFDNTHLMDEASFELIDYLANIKKTIPLCIILSYRKKELEKNKTANNFIKKFLKSQIAKDIALTKFGFKETNIFIQKLLGIKYSPTAFSTEIFKYTEGNPGFIIDVITALCKDGKLYTDSYGNWCTDFDHNADYSMLYIPSSKKEAVQKHIDNLKKDSYKVLELISAFNFPIYFHVLEQVSKINHNTLKSILEELISYQLIEKRLSDLGYTYAFHSKNIKTEIYMKIDSKRKKELHQQYAMILESIYSKEERINVDELIYHCTKADSNEKALKLIIKAAEKMLKLHISAQTMAYLKKGIELSKKLSSVEHTIKILLMMGELYRKNGENQKAFDCYNEVLEYAIDSDDKITIAKVKEMIGALYTRKNDFNKALILLNESLSLSKEIGYVEGYLESLRRICWIYIFKRKNSEAIDIINNVLKEYPDEKYSFYHATLYNVLGTHYLEIGNIDKALYCYNKSIELFEKSGENIEVAYPLNNIATVFAEFLNDNKKAREYFHKSLQINIDNNLVEGISSCYDNLGETCRLEDDYKNALKYYFKCEEKSKESDLYSILFGVYKNILLAYLELDEYDKSLEYLTKAKVEIKSNADRGLDLQIFYEYAARFYYEIGSFKEAREHVVEKMELCKNSDSLESISLYSIKILSEYYMSPDRDIDTLFTEFYNLLPKYKDNSNLKEQRETLHRFANVLIEEKKFESAILLLNESNSLSTKIDTQRLKIEYLILLGAATKGKEGIDYINEALDLNEKYQSLRMQWKGYKALGDIFFEKKNNKSAYFYYTKALNTLYSLIQQVPEKYKETFLYSHNRHIPRERLLSIRLNLLSEYKDYLNNQINKKNSSNFNVTQFFFEIINSQLSLLPEKMHFKDYLNNTTLGKIKDVFANFSNNHLQNLKQILEISCKLTYADTGFILKYNDNMELDVFVKHHNNSTSRYYQYIIEQASENPKGIFISDIFNKKIGNTDITLPGEIKAVICIPIHTSNTEKKHFKEKRKYASNSNLDVKGYIYLSTNNIFNRFTWDNFNIINILSKQSAIIMDNYNLKLASSIDKLTGAYTRKHFENNIETYINKACKNKQPLSFIMADIDKFKNVNDNFGHQKGDEILAKVGSIILNNIRSTDMFCRYGGEEFIIVLPNTSLNDAEIMAEKLRSAVENAHLMGKTNSLTISLGISSYPKHSQLKDELIAKADQALYHAKESGRNQYSVWTSKMQKISKRMDSLAGIITGNVVQDQRNVLAILEINSIINSKISTEEKIHKILKKLIEIFEAEHCVLIKILNSGSKKFKTYMHQKATSQLNDEESYNQKVVEKVIKTQTGTYMLDWDNVNIIDSESGEPILNSLLVEPIIKNKSVTAVLYLSCPIIQKEYGFNELNFLSALGDIISPII